MPRPSAACRSVSRSPSRPLLRTFFEVLLLPLVGLLVPRAPRLGLRLAAPEEPSDALRMRVAYAPFHQKLMRLGGGGYLAPLHRLLQFFPRLLGEQLLGTTLIYPAHQKLPLATPLVNGEPSLALTPAIAQSLGRFREVFALPTLKEPQHPHPVKQVGVSMALLKLLELFYVFLDHVRIIYLRHGHIMPLLYWIGIRKVRIAQAGWLRSGPGPVDLAACWNSLW